jgi:carbon starvation protein CstA
MSVLASQIHIAPITYSSLIAEIIFATMALVSALLFKFR